MGSFILRGCHLRDTLPQESFFLLNISWQALVIQFRLTLNLKSSCLRYFTLFLFCLVFDVSFTYYTVNLKCALKCFFVYSGFEYFITLKELS